MIIKEVLLLIIIILKAVVAGFEPHLDSGQGTNFPRPSPLQGSAAAVAARIMGLGSAGTGGMGMGGAMFCTPFSGPDYTALVQTRPGSCLIWGRGLGGGIA